MAGIELYLIRHAIAAERGEAYPDDTKRPLTAQGIARMRRITKGLSALGVAFDQILSSPLVRARQTAEILAQGLSSSPPIATCAALAPGGKYSALLDDLAKYSRRSRIALVGHEPELGSVTARLLGTRGAITFRKGGICRIDFEALPPAGPGHLVWFATPKMLRRMG